MHKSLFVVTLLVLMLIAFASCTPRYGCPGVNTGKTFRR